MTYTTIANKVFEKYYNRQIDEDLLNEVKNEFNGKKVVYNYMTDFGYVVMNGYIFKFDDVKKCRGYFTKIQVLVPTEDDVEIKYEKTRG